MIRVLPRKDHVDNIDCHSICSHLSNTGGELHEKVIYCVNSEDNCLDIKYKSRKGRGELGIESQLDEFDIWIITNWSDMDYVECLNWKQYELISTSQLKGCLYRFDEVFFVGNQEKLKTDFYPFFFKYMNGAIPKYLEIAINNSENNSAKFKSNGLYTEGTTYNVGEEFSKEPEKQSKHEFYMPRNGRAFYGNMMLLPSCMHDHDGFIDNLIEGLKGKFKNIDCNTESLMEIQFRYNNRIVKKIEFDNIWRYYNGEFFDNLADENWLDYNSLKRRGLT